MVQRIEEARQVSTEDGTTIAKRTQVIEDEPVAERTAYVEQGESVIDRVIWFVTGVLLTLLAFRFVLAMLGANPANGFADFIYNVSQPFVAPFFNLFGYNLQYGVSRFEIFTLVAMAVYAIIAYGLTRLVHLADRDRTRAYR